MSESDEPGDGIRWQGSTKRYKDFSLCTWAGTPFQTTLEDTLSASSVAL